MSFDTVTNAFSSRGESPGRDSNLDLDPNIGSDSSSDHSSRSSGRGKRGGRNRNRSGDLPKVDTGNNTSVSRTPSPCSDSDAGELVSDPLTIPSVVGKEDDMSKVERDLFESMGKPLTPLYEAEKLSKEDLDSFEQEELVSNMTNKVSHADYYRVSEGLCVKRIPPLLRFPPTLVANSRTFEFEDGVVVGRTRILDVAATGRKGFLTDNAHWAVVAQSTFTTFAKLPKADENRKRYIRNLKVLSFMLATWNGLLLSYQLIHEHSRVRARQGKGTVWTVSSNLRRELGRFKVRLLAQPMEAAKEVKLLSGFARSWFFGGKKPRQALLRTLERKHDGLIFSYVGRAMPPPGLSDIEKGYGQLVDRLCSEPPPEVVGWRTFCHEYLCKYTPKSIADCSYPTDASAGACLGYTRNDGGVTRAIQDLVGLGLALMKAEPEEDDVVLDEDEDVPQHTSIELILFDPLDPYWLSAVNEDDKSRKMSEKTLENLAILNKVSVLGKVYQKALARAVDWTFDRLKDGIPFVAVGAPEAGLKTRYPTMAPIAVLLVSQLLRRAADLHLKQDSRARESLGGAPEIKLGRVPGPWYSQDLTSATDLHPFWLQRTFYEELVDLHPTLQKYRKWLPVLFGPRHLISPNDYRDREFTPPDNPYLDVLSQDWEKAYPDVADTFTKKFKRSVFGRGGVQNTFYWQNGPVPEEDTWLLVQAWSDFWGEVHELPFKETTTGNPMGEAASFPLLPLVTIFSAERSGLPKVGTTGDDARIPLGQKSKPKVVDEQKALQSSRMIELLDQLPPNWRDWSPRDRLSVHELSLAECGAVLSLGNEAEGKPNKIFLHPVYHLYKEIPMRGDRRVPFIPTKLLSAPPGGSKGNVNWFNQPTAVRQHCVELQYHIPIRLWRKLPYWNETVAAFSKGLPVREPVTLGGINHPAFPHSAGVNPRRTQGWLSKLSQITLVDWATGTGLSPLPSTVASIARKAAKSWLTNEVRQERERRLLHNTTEGASMTLMPYDSMGRGTLPTLKESAQQATQASSAYLLYTKQPTEFQHPPSVVVAAAKFNRQLRQGFTLLKRKSKAGTPMDLSFSGTMGDIARKQYVYLNDPDIRIPERKAPRTFGLEASKFDPNRVAWRWDWLERSAPTDEFINAFFPNLVGHPLEDLPGSLRPSAAEGVFA